MHPISTEGSPQWSEPSRSQVPARSPVRRSLPALPAPVRPSPPALPAAAGSSGDEAPRQAVPAGGTRPLPRDASGAALSGQVSTGRPRVVLVDDHAALRAQLRLLFQDSGLLVVAEAGEGGAALEAVRLTAPDVVVTDVRMPGMDGLEVTRRMRAERPGLPVVVYTGDGSRVVGELSWARAPLVASGPCGSGGASGSAGAGRAVSGPR